GHLRRLSAAGSLRAAARRRSCSSQICTGAPRGDRLGGTASAGRSSRSDRAGRGRASACSSGKAFGGVGLMDFGFSGRKALVVGASRGLGAASAKMLAAEGAKVFGAARNLEAVSEWSKGLDVTPVKLDLTDPASVAELGAQMAEEGIDILVNNS